MGDKRNYAALDWVIGEIGETLKDARQALEAFVEDPRDTARIRFCLTHIHQVHGSLQMVEFHGASLFAEEMELLASALMNGTVANEKEAQEVLMRSLLQLPIYLEHVKIYHEDHPGVVLPLLNDLRAVRKQSFLSETNLFNPDLTSLASVTGQRHPLMTDSAKLKQILKKLREMYQYAAASVLRGIKIDDNLAYIDKVFRRLEGITAGTACHPLWQVSTALIEALLRDDVELSVAVRGLLRQLARELRILEEHCPAAFDATPREPLLRNLLYYVARAEGGGERVAQVKQRFALERALLGGGAARSEQQKVLSSAPEPDAVRAVVVALQDELNTVKHLLNLALSGQGGLSDIEEMLPVVKRIGDTLAVLGIGDMRKLVMEQFDQLKHMCQYSTLSDTGLLDVAGRMADLEHRLEAIGRRASKGTDYINVDEREVEIDSAKEAVISECRTGLESVKEAIVESMSSKWNPTYLPSAVETLYYIQGGLSMVPLPRPALILGACGKYIEQQLVHSESTPGSELQVLAEAIASIDYYLERLAGGHGDDVDSYLDMAEASLAQLGYAVSETMEQSQEAEAVTSSEVPLLDEEVPEPEGDLSGQESESITSESTSTLSVTNDGLEGVELEELSAEGEEDEDEIDEEIIEIFVEEAAEVQQTLADTLPKVRAALDDEESLIVVRRAFHTLKGSGRMVEAKQVGELAWSIEHMLNRVLDKAMPMQTEHLAVIDRALVLIPELIKAFQEKAAVTNPERVSQCIGWASELAEGNVTTIPELSVSDDSESSVVDLPSEESDDSENYVLWDIFVSEAGTHLAVVDDFIAEMEQAAPLYDPPSDDLQRALHTLKGSAHMAAVTSIAGMITPLENLVKEMRSYQLRVNDDILQLIKDAATYTREGLQQIVERAPVNLPRAEQFIARVNELFAVHVAPLIHMKEHEGQDQKQVDPRLLSIFMAEEMRLLLDADQLLMRLQAAPDTIDMEVPALMAELKTLSEGAEQANLPPMSELSAQLETIYHAVSARDLVLDQTFFSTMDAAHDGLLDMVDSVAAGQNIAPLSEAVGQQLRDLQEGISSSFDPSARAQDTEIDEASEIATFQSDEDLSAEPADVVEGSNEPEQASPEGDDTELDTFEAGFSDAEVAEAEQSQAELDTKDDSESTPLSPVTDEVVAETDEPVPDVSTDEVAELDQEPVAELAATPTLNFDADMTAIDSDDFDPDILEIFLEEANELIEELDEAIHNWDVDWDDSEASEIMKRALHTLKGGAYLSGLKNLGELTHVYESYLISESGPQDKPGFFSHIHQYQDALLNGIRAVRGKLDGEPVSVPAVPPLPQAPPAMDEHKDESEAKKVEPEAPTLLTESATTPADTMMNPVDMMAVSRAEAYDQQPTTNKRQAPQEMVRVSADLLEEMVNLAGETSISRGRLEQQVNDLGSAVDEVDGTLRRMNEQLRRLDRETEAQFLFRQEQMAADEHFDPLEMDRYSHLQQLTRSLMESASDLADLKGTLTNKLKDTETLLLQQSRINSSLQEGLMRSRMVPFSRLVPRLRRIVRQVSGELGKHVSFELDNIEGEMDRSVLERMVAPLEHMLRNAVDHGIESPQERARLDKPETGRVLLSLAREGGDILLRLADDGCGIDLPRVRNKAIERGLMAADAELSDYDIMQFILQAGFSTADNVTQISGRGVGMDVVAAEIKQLGGSMVIDSKAGVGSQFTVRLPFTVSVNRALLVQLNSETYAIPLNTIEGIVRVSPFELEHYYHHPRARFEYAGENYQVRHLGTMLGANTQPSLEGQLLPLPVILVRSAKHTMAFQVDSLLGSREIVVKSLGPQFAAVQGVSGATVMGDGSVVVIVDPHALLRRELALVGAPAASQRLAQPVAVVEDDDDGLKTVLVVDDSVTVRKVTSRFLEREGFNAIVAKDGVDALQVLQETIPDLMLLDIEMPRMDGFEVAKHIRSSSRLKHIPIVMITSRTGDKHRQHALSIGVDDYVGKPYQEEALLKIMQGLLRLQSATA